MRTNRYILLKEHFKSTPWENLTDDQMKLMMIMVVESESNGLYDIITAASRFEMDEKTTRRTWKELIDLEIVHDVWAIHGEQMHVFEDSESLPVTARVKELRNTVFIRAKDRPAIERQLWLSRDAQKHLQERMVIRDEDQHSG